MHSRLPRGVRPRLEGKPRTPLSSRVATLVSWSPLSGLKGVQPPLPFGERTRDCSPGHAGKEGPHLARTGASQGFPRTAEPMGVFLPRHDEDLREPLVPLQGSQVSMRVARGSVSWLSSHGRGIATQDILKHSRGLSRVAAENPGFPQLVPVTSGSFSLCL